MKKIIAVLLTCHNRREKTLLCLENFFESQKTSNLTFHVFLVDDGSNDGTSSAILKKFPTVEIIKGNGELFWNKGMRLAWSTASSKKDFDYYIWLNDDTFLFKDSITHIMDCYNNYKFKNNIDAIVVGACKENYKELKFSYGLRSENKEITPNGSLQKGNMMNGNFVLISNNIFKKVGNLSKNYTHSMGDYDYGLRALEQGFNLITTKQYVAVCEVNMGVPAWCNTVFSFVKRWSYFHSPLGLNINEYKVFRKRFRKSNYYTSIIKVYLRCFFPRITNKIKAI